LRPSQHHRRSFSDIGAEHQPNVLGEGRAAEKISLNFDATLKPQSSELMLSFDTFRRGHHAKAPTQIIESDLSERSWMND